MYNEEIELLKICVEQYKKQAYKDGSHSECIDCDNLLYEIEQAQKIKLTDNNEFILSVRGV